MSLSSWSLSGVLADITLVNARSAPLVRGSLLCAHHTCHDVRSFCLQPTTRAQLCHDDPCTAEERGHRTSQVVFVTQSAGEAPDRTAKRTIQGWRLPPIRRSRLLLRPQNPRRDTAPVAYAPPSTPAKAVVWYSRGSRIRLQENGTPPKNQSGPRTV